MNTQQSPPPPNIYHIVRPFYILSKLLGFSWFPLHGYKWKMEKWLNRILMIVHVSLRAFHVYTVILFPFASKYSPIIYLLRYTFLAISCSQPLLHTLVAFWKRDSHYNVLSSLENFD